MTSTLHLSKIETFGCSRLLQERTSTGRKPTLCRPSAIHEGNPFEAGSGTLRFVVGGCLCHVMNTLSSHESDHSTNARSAALPLHVRILVPSPGPRTVTLREEQTPGCILVSLIMKASHVKSQVTRRAGLAGMLAAAGLLTRAPPSDAAFGQAANIFGKPSNIAGAWISHNPSRPSPRSGLT